MEKDLVCGTEIDEKTAASHQYEGKTYHFCSETCRDRFSESPERFIG